MKGVLISGAGNVWGSHNFGLEGARFSRSLAARPQEEEVMKLTAQTQVTAEPLQGGLEVTVTTGERVWRLRAKEVGRSDPSLGRPGSSMGFCNWGVGRGLKGTDGRRR
jgi:hypothetical protein